MLESESILFHLLKGVKIDVNTTLYEESKHILQRAISDNWNVFGQIVQQFPFISTFFLYQKVNGKIEFDVDEELRT